MRALLPLLALSIVALLPFSASAEVQTSRDCAGVVDVDCYSTYFGLYCDVWVDYKGVAACQYPVTLTKNMYACLTGPHPYWCIQIGDAV